MSSNKITYKVGSIPAQISNASDTACLHCGKEPQQNTCWKWEAYLQNGRLVSTEFEYWVDNQADIGVYYVCPNCEPKFASELLTEGS